MSCITIGGRYPPGELDSLERYKKKIKRYLDRKDGKLKKSETETILDALINRREYYQRRVESAIADREIYEENIRELQEQIEQEQTNIANYTIEIKKIAQSELEVSKRRSPKGLLDLFDLEEIPRQLAGILRKRK